MKAPFKVLETKGGTGIYNGVALIEFQKDDETKEDLEKRCSWWNSIWDSGFLAGNKNGPI
jgi:hypothetical protein